MEGRNLDTIRSHRDLVVWQLGMELAVAVYDLVKSFPKSELYGMTSQLTRAAVSVPANIAEGHARTSRKDYAHFVAIARGSLMETETYLMLAARLGYLSEAQAEPTLQLITRISKMLLSLRNKLTQ